MQKGVILENKIYCPSCNKSNYQLTNDYKLVEIEGKRYVEFVGRCLTDNCNEKFYYQSESNMSGKRFVISRDKEIEIRDEFIEGS